MYYTAMLHYVMSCMSMKLNELKSYKLILELPCVPKKNCGPDLWRQLCQILTDFKNSCIVVKRKKFRTNLV